MDFQNSRIGFFDERVGDQALQLRESSVQSALDCSYRVYDPAERLFRIFVFKLGFGQDLIDHGGHLVRFYRQGGEFFPDLLEFEENLAVEFLFLGLFPVQCDEKGFFDEKRKKEKNARHRGSENTGDQLPMPQRTLVLVTQIGKDDGKAENKNGGGIERPFGKGMLGFGLVVVVYGHQLVTY